MRSFFLLLFSVLLTFGVKADSLKVEPTYDKSRIEERKFSVDQLDDYRNDRDFIYHEKPPKDMNWWEKFIKWLDSLFSVGKALGVTWKILPYILVGAALVALILGLLNTPFSKLITGKGAKAIEYAVHEENIHEIDFDKEINQAIEEGLYRKAVRLSYLHVLKMLSDKELINWKIHKTNADYLNELTTPILADEFREVTHVFEETWYGDKDVDKTSFTEVSKAFSSYKSKIKAAP